MGALNPHSDTEAKGGLARPRGNPRTESRAAAKVADSESGEDQSAERAASADSVRKDGVADKKRQDRESQALGGELQPDRQQEHSGRPP